MSTTASSPAPDGMYSKLLDDEGSYDEFNRSPDVQHGGKSQQVYYSSYRVLVDKFKPVCFVSAKLYESESISSRKTQLHL